MNRWSKAKVIGTIKKQASRNAQQLVYYVAVAKQHEYNSQESEDARRMAQLYMHQLDEDVNVLCSLNYITFNKAHDMGNSIWNYYRKVYQ